MKCTEIKYITSLAYYKGLLDNSPTNQLAVSQVADLSTRGQINLPTWSFL